MNLLKKNKYSIRKYKVGIFSTLIGTVLLLSNPNGAQALTTDQNVQGESNQALPGNSHNTNVDTSRDITNSSQNTPNQHTTANASTNQALANHHNVGESNQVVPMPVQPSTSSASNNNHSDAKSTATESAANTNNNLSSNNNTLNVPNNTDNNDSARHLTLKEIQEDVRHSSDKPELVAIAEEASNRPKKADVLRQQILMQHQQIQRLHQQTQRQETVVHQLQLQRHTRQQLIPMPII